MHCSEQPAQVRLELLRFSLDVLDFLLSVPCLEGDLLVDRGGVTFFLPLGLCDCLRGFRLGDFFFLGRSGDCDGDLRLLALSGDWLQDLRLLVLSGDWLGDLRLLVLSGDWLGDLRLLTLAGDWLGDLRRLNLNADGDGDRRLLGLSGDRIGDRRLLAGDCCRLQQITADMSVHTGDLHIDAASDLATRKLPPLQQTAIFTTVYVSDTHTCHASLGICLSVSACKQKGAPLLLQVSVSGVSSLSGNPQTHSSKVRHQSSPHRIIIHIGFGLSSGNALTHSIKVKHQSSPDRIIIHIGFGSFPQGTAVQAGHTELCELFGM